MTNDEFKALNKLGDSSSLSDIERNECETIIRAALAPVDVEGLKERMFYDLKLVSNTGHLYGVNEAVDYLAAKGLLCNNDAANITQEDLYVTQVPAAPKKEEK